MRMFNYCISNPPYQDSVKSNTNGQTVVKNIFHLFHYTAAQYCEKSTMIYPAGRWMQAGGKGLKDYTTWIINNPHLKDITYYEDNNSIFNTVKIKDGVSIVNIDNTYYNNRRILLNNEDILIQQKILPMSSEYITILNKVSQYMNDNNLLSLNDIKESRSQYGIESNFVEKNKSIVYDVEHYDELEAPIRIFTNDKSGVSGRTTWFCIEKDNIPKQHDSLNKYQFIIKSAQFGKKDYQLRKGMIIKPNEAFGRSRVSIYCTENEVEIINFEKYITTNLCELLLYLSAFGGLSYLGVFVPVLDSYNDNSVIDFNDNISEQLYALFGFSDDEIKLIENF